MDEKQQELIQEFQDRQVAARDAYHRVKETAAAGAAPWPLDRERVSRDVGQVQRLTERLLEAAVELEQAYAKIERMQRHIDKLERELG